MQPTTDLSAFADSEAESAVIGAVILDANVIGDLGEISPEDFRDVRHRNIYAAISAIHSRGEPVDLVTISRELDADGSLKKTGGRVYLQSLAESAVTVVGAGHHAMRVIECSRKRKLHERLITAASDLRSGSISSADARDRVLSEIFASFSETGGARHVSELARESGIKWATVATGGMLGLSTGFHALDELTQGLQPGGLYCFSGYQSGSGKSALVMNLVRRMDVPTLVFSAEMSDFSLWLREMSAMTGEPTRYLIRRDGQVYKHIEEKLFKASGDFSARNLWIDTTGGPSLEHILREIYRHKHRNGIKLVVLDMLQHVKSGDRTEYETINRVGSGLRAVAKQCGLPVVFISKLNKQEQLTGLPEMKHLHGSSWIDSDASFVGFIVPEKRYREIEGKETHEDHTGKKTKTITPRAEFWNGLGWEEPAEKSVVILNRKNRHGPPWSFPLNAELDRFRFQDVPRIGRKEPAQHWQEAEGKAG